MAKRYKDNDGAYLVAQECRDGWELVWAFEDDDGCALGDEETGDPVTSAAWSAVEAFAAANPDTVSRPRGDGFVFNTERTARKVLAVVNAAMLAAAANKPLPDWAQKAIAAGWKAPKGWTP